jgi:hypothetical protein
MARRDDGLPIGMRRSLTCLLWRLLSNNSHVRHGPSVQLKSTHQPKILSTSAIAGHFLATKDQTATRRLWCPSAAQICVFGAPIAVRNCEERYELQVILVVPAERIELPTNGLQNRCSTAELRRL